MDVELPDGTVRTFPYKTSTEYVITGTPGQSVSVKLGGIRAPNVEPVAWYAMDEVDGDQVNDEYRDHHGQVSANGARIDFLRKITGAASMHFDGEGEVVVPDAPGLRVLDHVGMAAAFYPESATAATLLRKEGSYGLAVEPDGNGVSVRAFVRTQGGLRELRSAPLELNAWHDARAFLQDGQFSLLVDGTLTSIAVADELDPEFGDLAIGTDFVGNLDDVRVYNPDGPKLLSFIDGTFEQTVLIGIDGTAEVGIRSLGNLRLNCPNGGGVEIQASNGATTQRSLLVIYSVELLKSVLLAIEGFVAGNPETIEGTAGDVIASVLAWGDIRDLALGLWAWWKGNATATDYVVMVLAAVGIITTVFPPGDIAVAGVKIGAKLLEQLPAPLQRAFGEYLVGGIREFFKGDKAKLRQAGQFLAALPTTVASLTRIANAVRDVEHLRGLIRLALNGGNGVTVLRNLDGAVAAMRLRKLDGQLGNVIDVMVRQGDEALQQGVAVAAWSEEAILGAGKFLEALKNVKRVDGEVPAQLAKRIAVFGVDGAKNLGWHGEVTQQLFTYIGKLPDNLPGAEGLLGKAVGDTNGFKGMYLNVRALTDAPEVLANGSKTIETLADRVSTRGNREGIDYILRKQETLPTQVGYPPLGPFSDRVPELWEVKYVRRVDDALDQDQVVKHVVDRVAPIFGQLQPVLGPLGPAARKAELGKIRLKYEILVTDGANMTRQQAADKLNAMLAASKGTSASVDAVLQGGFKFTADDIFIRVGDPLKNINMGSLATLPLK